MTRNLKTLGLALVAVFALSAVVASAASAQGKITSDGPVTGTGTEITPNKLTALGRTVECPGSTMTFHEYNVTPHKPVPDDATTATATPHYKNCTVPGVGPATVIMNGCHYVFHIGGTTGVADQFSATIDIVCPAGKVIEVQAFSSHPGGIKLCTTTVKAQTGLVGARATTNTASDDVVATGEVGGIHVEQHGLCGAKTETGAKFDLNLTIQGKNAAGGATGITVTG
jgi:hypothetical protein